MNPARILVVADEIIAAQEIAMYVAAMGHQVVGTALNAQEAPEFARKHRPDLVLMDINLPGERDGITAAEKIRTLFHLPVVFLTACSEEATLERAKLAEPYGYILKPFEERELKTAIEIALHRHHAEREILRFKRLYEVLSQVNQAIVRANSREELLVTICRIMVERGAVNLAWIGWLDPKTAAIRPVARWGNHEELLNLVEFHADEGPGGHSNPGRAVRENRPVFCNECVRGKCLYPAELAPARFGFNSCGSFPIHFQGQVCGALNLCIEGAGFFQEREITLLKEVARDISFALDKLEGDAKRIQAEEKLRKSEEKYRLLVETANEGIWALDRDHTTTYINKAMADMLGYEPREIIGTKAEEYCHPEDLSFHRERIKKRHAGEDEVYERCFRRRDGTTLWVLASSKALQDDQGRFIGSFAMCTDLSERKQAEETLHHRNRQLREMVLELEKARNMQQLIIESIPVRVFWKDRELRFLGCNDLFARDAGFSHSRDLLGQDDFAMAWSEQADLYRADDRRVMESGLPGRNIIEPLTLPDGSLIWVSTSKVPLYTPDGELFGILGVYEDITERREAFIALRKSEEKQRSIMRAAPIGIGVVVDRVLEDVNDCLCAMTGYSKEELLGKDARILYPTRELYEETEKRRKMIGMGSGTVETQWKRKNGVLFDILLSSSPINRDNLLTGVTFTAIDITERKLAEEQLMRSEKRFRSILDQAADVILVHDLHGRFLDVNRQACKTLGYSREELLAMKVSDIDPRAVADAPLWESIAKGERFTFQSRHTRKDGSTFPVELTIGPLEVGEEPLVLGIIRDITERKLAEEKLKEREELFSTIFGQALDAIALVDENGRFVEFNTAAHAGLGFTRREFSEMSVHDVEAEHSQELIGETIAKVIGTDGLAFETKHRCRSGELRDVRVSLKPLHLKNRTYLAAVWTDITERKQMEEELRYKNILLATQQEVSIEGILIVDENDRIVSCNRRFGQILGIPSELFESGVDQPLLKTVSDRVADRQAFLERVRYLYAHREESSLEEIILADGRVLERYTAPMFGKDRSYLGRVWYFRDVTERKQAETVLRERLELQNQFATIAATVPGMIFSFQQRPDRSVCMPFATEMIGELYGLRPEDVREDFSPAFARMHPDDIDHVRESIAVSARTMTPWRDSFRIRHPGKGELWVEGNSLPRLEPDGGIIWHGFVMDITARKHAEEERTLAEARLRQAQKMEALGTLAGGIAHDFNNILGVIMGYAEMAGFEMSDQSPARGDLSQVLKAANRAKDLVGQILAFSRQKEQEKRPMLVGPIIKEGLKMLRATLPSTIEIVRQVDSKARIIGDPSEIHQVLMNLCTNAGHAMADRGGTLKVGLEDVRYDAGAIPPDSGLRPGAYVKLTVGDTGHGIDPSILGRIFDPFFTTKEQGVGTGLGLSVVHGIISNHGGTVQVESLPGQGTTFHVFFPSTEEVEVAPAATGISLPGGKERVLVVDDEPALAGVTAKILSRLGYKVEMRMSGADALEAVLGQSEETRFDLVITDLTMPHLTGMDLARELLGREPRPAILLCTGFSDQIDPEKMKAAGIKGFLMKPVVLKDLAEMVRKVLDERTKN